MAAVKNLNTDYTINNKFVNLANVTLSTHTVFIDGNLIVGGNSTNVYKTDLNVTDNIITLNSGEAGNGVSLGTSGISVDRGTQSNVAIVWNESLQAWTLTNDGSTYQVIQATTVSAVTTPQVYALVL